MKASILCQLIALMFLFTCAQKTEQSSLVHRDPKIQKIKNKKPQIYTADNFKALNMDSFLNLLKLENKNIECIAVESGLQCSEKIKNAIVYPAIQHLKITQSKELNGRLLLNSFSRIDFEGHYNSSKLFISKWSYYKNSKQVFGGTAYVENLLSAKVKGFEYGLSLSSEQSFAAKDLAFLPFYKKFKNLDIRHSKEFSFYSSKNRKKFNWSFGGDKLALSLNSLPFVAGSKRLCKKNIFYQLTASEKKAFVYGEQNTVQAMNGDFHVSKNSKASLCSVKNDFFAGDFTAKLSYKKKNLQSIFIKGSTNKLKHFFWPSSSKIEFEWTSTPARGRFKYLNWQDEGGGQYSFRGKVKYLKYDKSIRAFAPSKVKGDFKVLKMSDAMSILLSKAGQKPNVQSSALKHFFWDGEFFKKSKFNLKTSMPSLPFLKESGKWSGELQSKELRTLLKLTNKKSEKANYRIEWQDLYAPARVASLFVDFDFKKKDFSEYIEAPYFAQSILNGQLAISSYLWPQSAQFYRRSLKVESSFKAKLSKKWKKYINSQVKHMVDGSAYISKIDKCPVLEKYNGHFEYSINAANKIQKNIKGLSALGEKIIVDEKELSYNLSLNCVPEKLRKCVLNKTEIGFSVPTKDSALVESYKLSSLGHKIHQCAQKDINYSQNRSSAHQRQKDKEIIRKTFNRLE